MLFFMKEVFALVANLIVVIVVVSAAFSIYYSYRSRKAHSPLHAHYYRAKMNICLGIVLPLLGLNQYIAYDFSAVRAIIGAIFIALGLLNFFFGVKNYRAIKQQF
jgi:hypothetical protein